MQPPDKNTTPDPVLGWLASGDRGSLVMSKAENLALASEQYHRDRERGVRSCENGLAVAEERPQLAEQRRQALGKANRVRLARASLRREVKAGAKSITGILLEPPTLLLNVAVFELVTWERSISDRTASKIIEGLCTETLTLGAASPVTRRELANRVIARRLKAGQ